MRLTQFTTNESRRATNAVMLTEAKILNEWSTVGKMLVEYKLTPEQIQQIFKAAEEGQTAAGGNRTMLGQGKDQVAAVNKAWEDLKSQMQNSAPVKGFDQKVNAALNKIGMGSADPEFENQVSDWVQKYRDFAKQHPIAQGAIYAVLIALTGLSGAGIAGAATLGLLKMADRVLQGDRFTSALYKGAKTGAMAYAVGQLKDYFKTPDKVIPQGTPAKLPDGTEYVVQKGDTLSQIAQKNGVSVKDLMAANNGASTTTDLTTQGWNNDYHDAFSNQDAMGNYTGPTNHEYVTTTNPHITNPDVLKVGQKINIPGSLGPTQTYADGVGTAADTWDKVKDGTYSASEISRNQAAKWGLEGAGKYNPPAGDIASGAADKAADAATNVAKDAGTNAASNAAAGADKASDAVDYASSKTNPWDQANAKADADVAKFNADSQAATDAENAKNSLDYSDKLAKNPGSPVAYDDNGDMMPGFKNDPDNPGFLKQTTGGSSGTGPYDDGASQLGQNPDMTKVADTNQGRLKMNQWRQDVGSPNAQPSADTSAADTASDAAASASSNTPTMTLSDTGNGIKGDLTLPGGEKMPVTAYPSDGIQPRMPFGSEKVTVDFNGQKVDAWIYNGKAYIKDFDTNTLNAPAPSASTGSPFFDRMNRAAANGVRLRESRKLKRGQLREAEIKAIFRIAANQTFKRQAINEGVWDSIKGAASKAADWAQTKGHNLTTKITADKLKQAWEKQGSPDDSAVIQHILKQAGVADDVITSAFQAVANVRTQQAQDAQPKGQQGELDFGQQGQQGELDFGQPADTTKNTSAPAAKNTDLGPIGDVRPGDDKAPAKAGSTIPQTNYKMPTNMVAGAKASAPTTKTSQVPANWGGQQASAQPQGTSYEVGSKKAAPQQQAGNFSSRGIAGMDSGQQAQQQPEQPGFLQSKIKKGGYTYQPEMTEEMISQSLAKELGAFLGKKSADKRDISKRPKDREVQKKVTEVSDEKLNRYMRGVSDDSQKHQKDPTKRKPEKASRSVSGFAKAANRLNKRSK